MSTTVTYKGNTIATVNNNTKTLKTSGKYMEDDVTLVDVSQNQAIVITDELDSHGGTIRHINGIVVSGTKEITANGTNIDVTEYAAVDVAVPTGGTPRTSSDLQVSGATVTAPAGTYASDASASVASLTLPTSTSASATSGYTSKATISRSTSDQYINIGTGYNSAGAYYKVNAVANGSATAPASITGTSATVSTGTNTLTLSKTVSVTPSVTAGYVSSGTAGNASVSLTASVTTKAATTYHPSTSDQTISSGTYTTGTQTIKAVTLSNLTADNIKSGVVVKVGDSTDDDCVTSITGSYTGGSGTSKNVQVAQSTTRVANTAYTKAASLTCSVAGKYDIYWDCFRSSTNGTNGSQLYIGGSAYGSANTTFSQSIHVQNNHLTNVSLSANQEVAVYVRSRATNYYAYCGQLTIVQIS